MMTSHTYKGCRSTSRGWTRKCVWLLASLSLLLLATRSSAQDFGDYADDNQGPGGGGYDDFAQDDNLYADYAQRQQVKADGAAGGGGMTRALMGAGVGWVVGSKIHCGRLRKKLQTKFTEDQKKLYTQYYNDVYELQKQNNELAYYVEQMQQQAH